MPADERSVNFAEVVVEAAPAAEEPSMMQRLGSLGGSLKNMIAGAPAAADAADPNDEEQREESSTVSPLNTTVAPLREATAMKEASERHILPDEEPVNLHSEAPFCNVSRATALPPARRPAEAASQCMQLARLTA